MSFEGYELLCTKDASMIKQGDLVYCFKDDGAKFRIHTQRPHFGVHEISLPSSLRENFRVLR